MPEPSQDAYSCHGALNAIGAPSSRLGTPVIDMTGLQLDLFDDLNPFGIEPTPGGEERVL